MRYSNPRLRAEFDNWPIGGCNRGKCIFLVVEEKRGYRVERVTNNKFGLPNNPHYSTYGGRAVIVDGEDNKTYILQETPSVQGIKISRWDFKKAEDMVFIDYNPARYQELLNLINTAYEWKTTTKKITKCLS